MNRRTFLAVSGGAGLVEPIVRCAPRLRASVGADQVPTNRVARQPVPTKAGDESVFAAADILLAPSALVLASSIWVMERLVGSMEPPFNVDRIDFSQRFHRIETFSDLGPCREVEIRKRR